nr:uncharacterized protein LOC126528291 [Dermacentor andersoni]
MTCRPVNHLAWGQALAVHDSDGPFCCVVWSHGSREKVGNIVKISPTRRILHLCTGLQPSLRIRSAFYKKKAKNAWSTWSNWLGFCPCGCCCDLQWVDVTSRSSARGLHRNKDHWSSLDSQTRNVLRICSTEQRKRTRTWFESAFTATTAHRYVHKSAVYETAEKKMDGDSATRRIDNCQHRLQGQ